MRDIKFRAWDKNKKVFIPTDVWAIVHTDFNAFGVMLKDWEDYKEGEYFYEYAQDITQYTGLKDKNGKEIYEGDINQYLGIVIWNKDDASFCWEYKDIETQPMGEESDWCEIIGNIYENFELLNPLPTNP